MHYIISQFNKQLLGQIHLSSSKSESNRALIMNALSGNKLSLDNISDARDTHTLQKLLKENTDLWDVIDAGTTMRFCTAYLAVKGDAQIITGTDRMKQRPIGLLVDALRQLGAKIEYVGEEGYPPLRIFRAQKKSNSRLIIPGNISSQYISALLMIGPTLPNGIKIELTGEVFSRPYIEMTLSLMFKFGIKSKWDNNVIEIKSQDYQPAQYSIESDWSGASYWYAMVALNKDADIRLVGLRKESFQGDKKIVEIMEQLGVKTYFSDHHVQLISNNIHLSDMEIDFRTCPDLAQTVMVVAALKNVNLRMTGLESLRIKETDRIKAMTAELRKLGTELIEKDKKWILKPGDIPEKIEMINTYEDHRMAMSFAPVSMIREVIIKDPDVVRKSYPGYWDHLSSVGFSISSQN